MRVTVRLFAGYREAAGVSRLDLDIAEPATAGDVVREIRRRHPHAGSGRGLAIARNGDYVDPMAPLAEGDELALIPPVSGGAVQHPVRVLVREEPLSVDEALAAVRHESAGGIVVFLGTVRSASHGKAVTRLDYEAYAEMAEAKMREIAARLERTHGARVALHHRVGTLGIGEIAVIVAASAPHRPEAFAAARAGIDELKSVVPIWKKEHTDDGAVWIEDHA
ncbi:MAG: molybdenum cofactor biosynthesis protein MoaE [Chloroflexi bacterium]|nr:molybdenum cofactor biosynthesis protein MoaE [Chloroflexota bacterium]